MAPKLQEVFSRAGTWDEIVVAELEFAPDIGDEILALWNKNQDIARQNGVTLTPMEFVEMFVAENVEAV